MNDLQDKGRTIIFRFANSGFSRKVISSHRPRVGLDMMIIRLWPWSWIVRSWSLTFVNVSFRILKPNLMLLRLNFHKMTKHNDKRRQIWDSTFNARTFKNFASKIASIRRHLRMLLLLACYSDITYSWWRRCFSCFESARRDFFAIIFWTIIHHKMNFGAFWNKKALAWWDQFFLQPQGLNKNLLIIRKQKFSF